MSQEKRCLELFKTFFKIGAFTFGGGYAMIPIIQEEVVTKKGWITEKDLLDVFAIAESTPGPIAINSATFIGRTTAGIPGAFCATFGVVLPSFLLIFAISSVLEAYSSLTPVRYAFTGIRAGVLALIIRALYSMYRQCPKNAFSYVIMGASFVAAAFLKVNVLFIIIFCALVGIIFSIYSGNAKDRKAK